MGNEPGLWNLYRSEGGKLMIYGAHVIVYSEDATADRDFFREVLGFSFVDAGHDWLIFALPLGVPLTSALSSPSRSSGTTAVAAAFPRGRSRAWIWWRSAET